MLQQGTNQRFDAIQDTAKEQSAAVGEADLRRMKRQFSSLKNTFLHYVVKDEFIAALADGLPNGTEEIQLAQFEEEANRTIDRLRALKTQNEQTQNEIMSIIGQINDMLESIHRDNSAALTTLSHVQQEVEAAADANASMPPPLPDGMDDIECQAALAEEDAQARELEAQIAKQMADIAELEDVLPRQREAVQLARAELNDLEEQRALRAGEASSQSNARFASSAAWAEETLGLLQSLGGVTVLDIDDLTLDVVLSTSYPKTAVSNGCDLGPCGRGDHHLQLSFAPPPPMDANNNNNNNGQGAKKKLREAMPVVTAAILTPPDVDTSEIIDAAVSGSRGADFVIREVKSRVAGALHRRCVATEATKKYVGASVDGAGVSIMAPVSVPLPNGGCVPVHVHLMFDQSWPTNEDVVRVVTVQCGERAAELSVEKIEEAKKIVLRGRGVGMALDAVVRTISQPLE